MEVQGSAHGRFGPVRECFAGILAAQPYSVSKPFAAVCALQLVQAGRLDLDAPVQRYWPGFRAPATVRRCCRIRPGW